MTDTKKTKGSMTDNTKPEDKPFRVVGTSGGYVMGHDTKAQADADASTRNDRAEAMGIKTRYSVTAHPGKTVKK